MDGRCSSESLIGGTEEVGIAPEASNVPGPGSTGSGGDRRVSHPLPSPSSSSPGPKRSRRSVQKRVVSVPIADAGDGSKPKGAGECTPPPDSWTWRKYGQKPIKGSPYPRGYYRCSSSKGCPARKQVERSRVDPTMLVVTYSFDHNHPWPLPRSHGHGHPKAPAPAANDPPPAAPAQPSPPDQGSDPDDKLSGLIGDDAAASSFMIRSDFGWFSDVGSPPSNSPSAAEADADALLYGPIFAAAGDVAMALPEEFEEEKPGGGGEEDALFAGLGELPEWSVVFRRGFLEREMMRVR